MARHVHSQGQDTGRDGADHPVRLRSPTLEIDRLEVQLVCLLHRGKRDR